MQRSVQRQVNGQQEGYFESVQKQIQMETLSFTPMKTFSNQIMKREPKKDQQVRWKLNEMKNPLSSIKKNNYRFSKNISFQNQEYYSSQDEEEENDKSDLIEHQYSSFTNYYKDQELIYHKKYNFGTNWIYRKQYYASLFVNPSNIEKLDYQYYFNQQTDSMPAEKDTLFDSHFQSGNLLSVYKVGNSQYDLILQNDINTKGNTQWFYFRITNPIKNTNIKINIVNMRKSDSLFNYGMMPCIYSLQEQKKTNKKWFRGGKNIKYFKNDFQIENSRRYYYTLTFTFSTPYQNDIIRIAQSYPYTYTDLNNYLRSIETNKFKKEIFEREVLVNTIGSNKVEVITIKQNNSKAKVRPFIIIIARQHPGQSPSSFICESLMEYLMGKDKEADFLRKNYQIKVIPMVNPDGVCAGNYRTNLFGYDLNRRWEGSKMKNLHQTVYIKKYITQITKGRQISFILDIHGHSRKMFSFFYGNPNPNSPIEARLFPLICSKINPYCIKFQDCTFTTQDQKRNTARVQLGLSYKCLNVFTFQASFFGYVGKDKQKKHFSIEDYKQLGVSIVKAIYIHQRGKQLYQSNPDHKDINVYKRSLNQLRNNMILISLGEKQNSGSQSNPEECLLKESQGLKLMESQEYSNSQYASKNIKNIKKVGKKQLIKLPNKSQRQMQVMDIAQVNSMYPSNFLALIPNSFLAKKRKIQIFSKLIQTENTPLIKIYQTCKQQQNKLWNFSEEPISMRQISSPQKTHSSNLLKSNIFSRPRSQSQDRQMISSIGLSKMSQRRDKDSKSIAQKNHKKALSYIPSKFVNRQTQTILTFNCMNLGLIKSKLQKQISILELKTVDPSYMSFNYNKIKQASGQQKASINILESLRVRKRVRP